MNRRIPYTLAFLCLAACSQEVPSVAPAPLPTPVAAAPAATAAVETGAAAETADSPLLSIRFVEKPACASGEAATVTAKWDVMALGVSAISLFVENPANPKKLWLDAGASGEETTGKWIYEKTRFTLQDRASGKILATRLLEKPCTP